MKDFGIFTKAFATSIAIFILVPQLGGGFPMAAKESIERRKLFNILDCKT